MKMKITLFCASLRFDGDLSKIGRDWISIIDISNDIKNIDLFSNIMLKNIIVSGCKFIFFYGRYSEIMHDKMEEIIVCDEAFMDVSTTFHTLEDLDDIAYMFRFLILEKGRGVVFSERWEDWVKSILSCGNSSLIEVRKLE